LRRCASAVIKILLVEDEPDILDLTAYVLRRARFVVIEATDGAMALRRWKADRPDLVLLDLGLPNVDGFEVLRRIRADEQTPVLVITGRGQGQDALRSLLVSRMSPKQIGNRRRRERGNEWDHTVPDSCRLRVNAPHDLVIELRLVTCH